MPFNIAIQMDPVSSIDIKGDTTFALALKAQERGHSLWYYTPDKLSYNEGVISAVGQTLRLFDNPAHFFETGSFEERPLQEFDVILMRQDPPFDMAYITATHLLEMLPPTTKVINNPAEVRNAPEKLLVTLFSELMPPTLISRDADKIKAFREHYQDIIIKPLFGNGGEGVFRLQEADQNLNALLEMFFATSREPVMVQKYLEEVRAGDKRIILINGEAKGAINRVPQEGEARSNLHVGGSAQAVELTKRDIEICNIIGPELKKRGLVFVGIDVIGDYLTEINVTSPTGIREIEAFTGLSMAAEFWNIIEEWTTHWTNSVISR
ncbi:MAG: glutathione synthase [Alphaproteobacteria bacterium]|nr:glutathione synthase [Alphaproteobacteria bacterium]MBL6776315.1 glutathione synthase [Alphaproteobacteria bacterium]